MASGRCRAPTLPSALSAFAVFVSRFRIEYCFHGVMRHNRHRLRCRLEPGERIWCWLADELQNCGDHTQNTGGKHRGFHYAPALLLRADQKPVDRLSFVVHNFKTPRSSRFV